MFEEQARVRDTMSQSDATKVEAVPNVHVIEVMSDEVSPAYHGTKQSFFGTVHRYRWALTWCLYMLWCVLANNYAKLAGQSVLGIPQFRKDFGKAYNGNYVLSATWQSAYYGAPQAA